MFTQAFKITETRAIQSTERQKLIKAAIQRFNLAGATINTDFLRTAAIKQLIVTNLAAQDNYQNNDTTKIYLFNEIPYFFEASYGGALFPTVYFLWALDSSQSISYNDSAAAPITRQLFARCTLSCDDFLDNLEESDNLSQKISSQIAEEWTKRRRGANKSEREESDGGGWISGAMNDSDWSEIVVWDTPENAAPIAVGFAGLDKFELISFLGDAFKGLLKRPITRPLFNKTTVEEQKGDSQSKEATELEKQKEQKVGESERDKQEGEEDNNDTDEENDEAEGESEAQSDDQQSESAEARQQRLEEEKRSRAQRRDWMERTVKLAFFHALKFSVADSDLPLLFSALLSRHLLAFWPPSLAVNSPENADEAASAGNAIANNDDGVAAPPLNFSMTQYKKLKNFMMAMRDLGIISISDKNKTGVFSLDKINRAHLELVSLQQTLQRDASSLAGADSAAASLCNCPLFLPQWPELAAYRPPEFVSVCVSNSNTQSFFDQFPGESKHDCMTHVQLRNAVAQYACARGLVVSSSSTPGPPPPQSSSSLANQNKECDAQTAIASLNASELSIHSVIEIDATLNRVLSSKPASAKASGNPGNFVVALAPSRMSLASLTEKLKTLMTPATLIKFGVHRLCNDDATTAAAVTSSSGGGGASLLWKKPLGKLALSSFPHRNKIVSRVDSLEVLEQQFGVSSRALCGFLQNKLGCGCAVLPNKQHLVGIQAQGDHRLFLTQFLTKTLGIPEKFIDGCVYDTKKKNNKQSNNKAAKKK